MNRPNSTRDSYSHSNRDTNGSRFESNRGSYGASNGTSSFMSRSSNGSSNGHSYNSGPPSGGFQRKINPNQHEEIHLRKPVWNSSTMKPFEKEFYRESSIVRNRHQNELNEFLNENNVTVSGNKFIKPILNFNECDIPDGILNKIKEARYEKPTPIQSMCWPTLLSGLDMVGIAQTGSGKTMGFVLPMLIHISRNKNYLRSIQASREDLPGPIGLVLAPTRELAIQIQQVAEEFGNLTGIRNVCVYGGASKMPQMQQIRRHPEIYIATPGRLLDFLKEDNITLNKCTFLVLDEADRMLDMGFEPQIRKIIEQIRPDRQTTMFSATWPKEVRKLAEDFISNYVHITIGSCDMLTANPNIKQIVELCPESEKENRLKKILDEIMVYRDAKVIAFAETKKRVDQFSNFIRKLGYYCLTIHGDKKQMERERVLNEFKKKSKSILCATDVAARGINISDIKYVINIDYPVQTEDYVHRIGRTARSGNYGTAFTFITSDNSRHVPKLIEVLKECNQFVSNELMGMARSFPSHGRGKFIPRNNYGNNQNGGRFNNGHSVPDYNNSEPRKRNAIEMNEYQNIHNSNQRKEENDPNGNGVRVKKCRWDNPPSVTPQNGYSNGNGHYSATNKLAERDTNAYTSRTNGSSIHHHQPPQSISLPNQPVSVSPPAVAQIPLPQAVAGPALPPQLYGQNDYIQYYQAIAAAAANNGGTWQQQSAYATPAPAAAASGAWSSH